jgi:hypothetical protein
MADKKVGLRKRQQIENTSKTMFTWVAIAAVALSVSVVVSLSLMQRLEFNQRVLSKKGETASNLKSNNAVVEELRNNVRERNTDQALLDTPRPQGTEPLSVVLDALPSQPNSSALGASLEQKLLKVSGVSIENLVVNSISGTESSSESTADLTTSSEFAIGFKFEVTSSDPNKVKKVLQNLEKSIRVMNVTSAMIEQNNGKMTLSVEGESFYAPEVTSDLKTEKVFTHPNASKSKKRKADQ